MTSILGNGNNLIQFYDSTNIRVGVACSNPSQILDVNGNANIGSNLYVQSNLVVGSSNPILQIQYSSLSPVQISQSNNGVGTFINYAAGNPGFNFENPVTISGSYLSNQGTFSCTGGANFQNSINVQNNLILSNTTGATIVYCGSNNLIGINNPSPIYTLDVLGTINASGGYCNLLINSVSNTSVNNAPTNYALSLVNNEAIFGSNIGVYCSNNIQYNQYYK